MSKHDPNVRLLHMRDFAQKALQLTKGKTRAEPLHSEVMRCMLPVGPHVKTKIPA